MVETRARVVAWATAILSISLLALSLAGDGSGIPGIGLLRNVIWMWIFLAVLSAGILLAWDLEHRARRLAMIK